MQIEIGGCFEDVVVCLMNNKILDIMAHPNEDKYPNQRIFIIDIEDCAYLVPFVEDGEWETVSDLKREQKHYQAIAKNSLKKDKRINIRLATKDLMGIQKNDAGRIALPDVDFECVAQVCDRSVQTGLNRNKIS